AEGIEFHVPHHAYDFAQNHIPRVRQMLPNGTLSWPVAVRCSLIDDCHWLGTARVGLGKHPARQQGRAHGLEISGRYLTYGNQRIATDPLACLAFRTEKDKTNRAGKRQICGGSRGLHLRHRFYSLEQLLVELRLLWLAIARRRQSDRKRHDVFR